MKVYIIQVIPEASLGKVSQEGYSTLERRRPLSIAVPTVRSKSRRTFTARQTSPTTSFTRSISSEKDSPARAFLSS